MKVRSNNPRPYYFVAQVRMTKSGAVRERKGCRKLNAATDVYDWLRYDAAPSWGGSLVSVRIYKVDEDGECSSAPIFIAGPASDIKDDDEDDLDAVYPMSSAVHLPLRRADPWKYGSHAGPPAIQLRYPK